MTPSPEGRRGVIVMAATLVALALAHIFHVENAIAPIVTAINSLGT